MDSTQFKKKELLIYHFGCYSNLVTIATKYVADAIHPKKASYQIWPQSDSKQKSYFHKAVVVMITKLP